MNHRITSSPYWNNETDTLVLPSAAQDPTKLKHPLPDTIGGSIAAIHTALATYDASKLKHPERSRTYIYADGTTFRVDNVTHVKVSAGGNHRLKTAGGHLHIVVPGWRAITIDADDWSF
jgi:hypothetical protein